MHGEVLPRANSAKGFKTVHISRVFCQSKRMQWLRVVLRQRIEGLSCTPYEFIIASSISRAVTLIVPQYALLSAR